MSEGVVYTFGFRDEAPHIIESTLLDGDRRKIEYVDTTFDKGLNPLFEVRRMYGGRAVKAEHIPTKI